MTNTREERVAPNLTLNGVEQPERIWLVNYPHAGDVCWSSDPDPEDGDELETVEYVRADTVKPSPDVWEALRSARRTFERLMMIAGDGTAVSLQAAAFDELDRASPPISRVDEYPTQEGSEHQSLPLRGE